MKRKEMIKNNVNKGVRGEGKRWYSVGKITEWVGECEHELNIMNIKHGTWPPLSKHLNLYRGFF